MSIDILVDNKPLLVEMFQKIGSREFTFIQHMAAVMGFVLGCIQMFLWQALNSGGAEEACKEDAHSHDFRCWASFVVLPVSGLIIGYFTNWLGITMIFRPVEPHIICGGYVNIQGVFLKRQKQVSKELSTMICKHLVNAGMMLEYVVNRPETMEVILELYARHMQDAFDQAMGSSKKVIHVLAGSGAVDDFTKEVIQITLDTIPEHSKE